MNLDIEADTLYRCAYASVVQTIYVTGFSFGFIRAAILIRIRRSSFLATRATHLSNIHLSWIKYLSSNIVGLKPLAFTIYIYIYILIDGRTVLYA